MQTPPNNEPEHSKKRRKAASNRQPQLPPARHRKFVLTKVSHVRAELGKLYGEARNRQIDVADASKLANMLGILHRIIADTDLEARIDAIEKNLER